MILNSCEPHELLQKLMLIEFKDLNAAKGNSNRQRQRHSNEFVG
jgi:hypothetical protein